MASAGASGVVVAEGDLRVRAMKDVEEDYARVVAWRNQPHVREWWDPDDPPMTLAQARSDLHAGIVGASADQPCFIEVDGAPIGFIQFSPWSAWQEDLDEVGLTVPDGAWTLDLYIGEATWIDRGIGTRVVRMLCDHLFRDEAATAVAFGVEVGNARARRAYEKAGMRPTVEFLDTDTRGGERVRSIVMVRDSPD